MFRLPLVRALALVALAATAAVAQKSNPARQGKAAAKATMKAERDSLKAITRDMKADKAALKIAESAHDTAKVARLKQEIQSENAARKALKAKLPAKKNKAKP